jgi:hypothetical protein
MNRVAGMVNIRWQAVRKIVTASMTTWHCGPVPHSKWDIFLEKLKSVGRRDGFLIEK